MKKIFNFITVLLILPDIIRLFKYSFEPINFNYEGLTEKEKICISKINFNLIKKICYDKSE